jgi:hypothetical protein
VFWLFIERSSSVSGWKICAGLGIGPLPLRISGVLAAPLASYASRAADSDTTRGEPRTVVDDRRRRHRVDME